MSLINAIVPKWLKRRIVREVRIPVRVPVLQSNLLENRVALITGGAGAIGSAIVRRFFVGWSVAELPQLGVRPWDRPHGRRELMWCFSVAIMSAPVCLRFLLCQ